MIKRLKKTKKRIKNKSRKTIQKGGSSNITESKPESLSINYGNIQIKYNQDLTGKDNFYNKEPTVIITNAKPNKLYMVTMTDPDAPNGKGNPENFVFTHWVFTQKQEKKEKQAKIIYVPYSPPTPPQGTHRYQFTYDITEIKNINSLIMNNNDNKMNYFSNKLINLNNKIINVNHTQFIVSKQ